MILCNERVVMKARDIVKKIYIVMEPTGNQLLQFPVGLQQLVHHAFRATHIVGHHSSRLEAGLPDVVDIASLVHVVGHINVRFNTRLASFASERLFLGRWFPMVGELREWDI